MATAPRMVLVTGASGMIGQALVARLVARGHKPVVLGRDPDRLAKLWPDLPARPLSDAGRLLPQADWLVHLAARNNDEGGTREDFLEANLNLTRQLFGDCAAGRSERAGPRGGRIFISSTRAIKPWSGDHYGHSKKEAENWILARNRADDIILRLPAVHRGNIGGRFAFLDRLPKFMQAAAVMASLRQQVHIDTVIDRILGLVEGDIPARQGEPEELADSKAADRLYNGFKRALDVVFALVVLTLFSWLLVLVWLAVRLSSKGPGIFAQQRVGRDGRTFVCYKFRTMHAGSKIAASHEVGQSAVTRVGRVLRKSKLDELPQVINLLRGEMSLVGPRPCLPLQHELVAERLARGVLAIVPGITGWAQINDIDMSDPILLAKTDAQYAIRRSLLLDLKILLATFAGSGLADRTR